MSFTTTRRATAPIAIALACGFGAMAAQAKDVTRADEQAVTVGMTRAQVQELLGKPVQHQTFALGNGSTWSYEIAGRSIEDELFDVDFTPEGTVKSVEEHMVIENGND